MKEDIEKRYHRGVKLQERSADSGGALPVIEGHAAVFNQETVIDGFWMSFREVIKPGAFAADIRNAADVRALVDHMPEKVIGRTKSGTLRLAEDATGLFTSTDPSNTSDGRDIVERIKRGDVDGMSFGFTIRKQVWVEDASQDMELREIHDVGLFDISPVTFPQYQQTDIGVRHMLADRDREEFENIGRLLFRLKNDKLRDGDPEEAQRLIEQLQKIAKKPAIEAAGDDALRKMSMAKFNLSLLALE